MNSEARTVLQSVREFIRQPYAWPGGYPKFLVMDDGETICATCARAEYRQISNATRHGLRDGWQAGAVALHMEGEPLQCGHCSGEIFSAYGVPDEDSCNCDDYSWHGEVHASACPLAGKPMASSDEVAE
jgi:hypothetical protein